VEVAMRGWPAQPKGRAGPKAKPRGRRTRG